MTNYEWIKSLSVDEMAKSIDGLNGEHQNYNICAVVKPKGNCNANCYECIKKYLLKEHKEGS